MTKKLYLEDTYQFYFEALIEDVGEDEKGIFIVLDQTAFYPQSGGQPSDQGLIKSDDFEIDVTHVLQIGNEIRHYTTSLANPSIISSRVSCFLAKERRVINARYHTAGHLLGNVVEILYPSLKAVKGHSFEGEAYVEFHGSADVDITALQNAINESIARNDKTRVFEVDPIIFEQQFYKLPFLLSENKKFRAMQIGDMLPVPCGGTHLSYIGEIIQMTISKIKVKNDKVRISYFL